MCSFKYILLFGFENKYICKRDMHIYLLYPIEYIFSKNILEDL